MKTRIVTPPEGCEEAARLLAGGELAALPTETVYGLGAAALNPLACAKIFEAKERPLTDPLILHLPGVDWLDRLAVANELARKLAEAFWPGPLTMVLPKRPIVPDIATAGQDTVAMRMSAHPVFQQTAKLLGQPIGAPSANRFGRISPTTAAHVLSELDGRIPLIVDGGPCEHGIESTIVLVREGSLEILRHGPVTEEQLAAFAPIRNPADDVVTPGRMKSHYAPRVPLVLQGEDLDDTRLEGLPPERLGYLAWSGTGEGYGKIEFLSPSQDLREAAANLYGAMRRLDEAGLRGIVAEPVPERGLGVAIMERLRKAAARE